MSKNAEGWIRHRGGKCPVDDGDLVLVRYRDGTEPAKDAADNWAWHHTKDDDDIMAYRLHKSSEHVEARSKPDNIGPFKVGAEADAMVLDTYFPSGLISRGSHNLAQGPLQWRDRIAEIDATNQALTTERAELVQKLAREGFELIGRINELLTDAAQKHEDMSDWRNWKEGDRIEVISKGFDGRDIGEMLTVDGLDNDDANQPVGVMGDDKTHSWPIVSRGHFLCIKWHSRPSA